MVDPRALITDGCLNRPISTDTASSWIQDTTRENFTALMLENSAKGPVLVKFWSPMARDSDASVARALKAYPGGLVEQALSTLAQAGMDDPDNPRIPLTLARLLIREGRLQQAQQILAAAPVPAGTPESVEIEGPGIHLTFPRAAEDAPPGKRLAQQVEEQPDDLEARLCLAAISLVSDDYEAALTQLLEIRCRNAGYQDRIGARGMQTIFHLLDDEGELVEKYRSALRRGSH